MMEWMSKLAETDLKVWPLSFAVTQSVDMAIQCGLTAYSEKHCYWREIARNVAPTILSRRGRRLTCLKSGSELHKHCTFLQRFAQVILSRLKKTLGIGAASMRCEQSLPADSNFSTEFSVHLVIQA